MTSIRELPAEVRSYLRSGVTVTSITQCVEELLLNSVDAGATCVAVRVDLDCFRIQVVDNGVGVAHEQLKLLGERYATSKCHSVADLSNLTYFGYRGEALASLRDSCSVLEITTKTKQSSKTYSKLFQDGRSLEVIESTIPRPSVGMTVTVHDLFSKFPVRRRSTNVSLELERIRQRVEGLALLKPEVSISLRNDSTGTVLLQTHKASNSLLTFQYLFGAAKAATLCEVNGSKNYFTVEGYVGKEGHSKKELQFLYVNGRLVLKTRIHKMINKELTNSAIFKRKYERSPAIVNKSVFVKSPGRQLERYPVFVLNIKCPWTKYDITFDPSKTLIEFKDWDTLLELTKEILDTFLKKENLKVGDEMETKLNTDILSVENEGKCSNEKTEELENCNVISPSKLKDTLFSKPAKRKCSETDLFKTPVSISIEEWKAENKIRKFGFNKMPSVGTQSGDNTEDNSSSSSWSDESQQASFNNGKQVSHAKGFSLKNERKFEAIKASNINKVDNRSLDENRNNTIGNNGAELQSVLPKVSRNASNSTAYLEQSQDKLREANCALLPHTGIKENVYNPSVTISSRSGLSEFKRTIGKPVTDSRRLVNVDEKLKASLNLPSTFIVDGKSSETSTNLHITDKLTSSLQRFRKGLPLANTKPEIQYTNAYKGMQSESMGAGALCKSDISLVDCRMDTQYTDLLSYEQSPCGHKDFAHVIIDSEENNNHLNDLQTVPDRYTACKLTTNRISSNSTTEKRETLFHDSSSNSSQISRKRQFHRYEKDTVAKKLSRLSRQKAAIISVSSSSYMGSPVEAGVICNENTMLTATKIHDLGSCRNDAQPSCSTQPNFEFFPRSCFTEASSFDKHGHTKCVDQNAFSDDESNKLETSDVHSRVNIIKPNETCLHEENSRYINLHNELKNDNGSKDSDFGDGISYSCDICPGTSGHDLQFQHLTTRNIEVVPANKSSKSCDTSQFSHMSFEPHIDISNNHGPECDTLDGAVATCEVLQEKTDMEKSDNERLTTIDNSENGQFVFSTQQFSPNLNASQSGLSDKITNIYISQGFTTRGTPMVTSPHSEGFSPCLSVSSNSTIISPCQLDHNLKSLDKESEHDNLPIQTDTILQQVFTDKENNEFGSVEVKYGQTQQNRSSPKISSVSDSSPPKLISDEMTIAKVIPKQSENLDKGVVRDGTKTVINSCSVTGTNSEDLIFSNKTVTISQMLISTPHEESQKSAASIEHNNSESIHFSDIFTQALAEGKYGVLEKEHTKCRTTREENCYEGQNVIECEQSSLDDMGLDEGKPDFVACEQLRCRPDCASAQSGQHLCCSLYGKENYSEEHNKAESEPFNDITSTNDEALDISDPQVPSPDGAGDDTLLQSTPDSYSVFSTWDENHKSDAIQSIDPIKAINVSINAKSSESKSKDLLEAVSVETVSVKSKENVCDKIISDKTTDLGPVAKHNIETRDNTCKDCLNVQNKPREDLEKEKSLPEANSEAEERKWIQLNDPQTGKKIHVHSLLGTTVTDSQWKINHHSSSPQGHCEKDTTQVCISKDWNKIEKLSPTTSKALHSLMMGHFTTDSTASEDNEENASIKWRDSRSLSDYTSELGKSSVEDMLTEWDNPVFVPVDKDVMNMEVGSLPKTTAKAYRTLYTCKFTKDMLNTVKVVGQVDKKFIACLMDTDTTVKDTKQDMLAVIDQHAAHERIRLELLTEEAYMNSDVDLKMLAEYNIDPPKHLQLTEDEVRVMSSYKEEFRRIGVKFHCDTKTRNSIVVETIPSCIMEKDVNYVKSMRESVAWNIVQALIKEHVELTQADIVHLGLYLLQLLVSTGGGGKRFPTVLHKALCAQACHGAIKFGDSLTLRECEALIRDLSRCDLPFQCAHGRPSVMPVLQLDQLRTKLPQQRKPQLYKLSNAIQKVKSPN